MTFPEYLPSLFSQQIYDLLTAWVLAFVVSLVLVWCVSKFHPKEDLNGESSLGRLNA
jgi:hypothetical protein